MAQELQPYVIEVVQGATMFREIAIKDEGGDIVDVSSATKTIKCANDTIEADIVVSQGTATNLIEIRGDGDAATVNWPVGSYPMRLWLDWGPGADIEDEVIFSAVIVVRPFL